MQQKTLSDLQELCPDMQQHYCDLQPEDLSLHSNSGDDHSEKGSKDKASSEHTGAELSQDLENDLWKTEQTHIDDDEQASSSKGKNNGDQCKKSDHPSGRMPSSLGRESSETTVDGRTNVLVPTSKVISISTVLDSAVRTAPSTETIVKKMDEVIAPTATMIITEENL